MYERLLDFFLTEPERLIGLGRGLVNTGGLVLVIGTIGRLATTAVGAIQGIGKHYAVERTLADLYPSLPTWWVTAAR